MIAATLKAQKGRGWSHDVEANYVAAPLSHGSNPNSNAAGRRREDDENLVAFALRSDPGGTGQGHNTNYVTGPLGGGNDGIGRRTEDDPNLVTQDAVRRLTPTECCRLQGFPDDWLGTPNEPPDSPRYAALGDAVTVNVAEWIGRRILEAEERMTLSPDNGGGDG